MKNNSLIVKTSALSITGNILLAILKWITGYFGHSYALIADAIESTSDIFSSALVLIGIKYANRPPDKNHPYGHGRAEPLITFIVVGLLVTSAIIIIYQSIQNIMLPHQTPEYYTLYVLGGVIIFKEFLYRKVIKVSEDTKSSSLKADAWHHKSDAITSSAAFIGISIAIIFGKGFETADDWAAIVAALILLYNSYRIFRPALGEIMDEELNSEIIADVRNIAIDVPGVIGTEKCFIRKTGMTFYVDLHIIVDGKISVKEGHNIAHNTKTKLEERLPLTGVLIHVEPFK